MKVILTSDLHYNSASVDAIEECLLEIRTKNPDVLVVAGDQTSSNQEEFGDIHRIIGGVFLKSKTKILVVRGNHDFWGTKDSLTSIEDVDAAHRKVFADNNLHWIQEEDFMLDGVKFVGFDGWYNMPNPATNDHYFINQKVMVEAFDKSREHMNRMLNTEYEGQSKLVCITHFPMFTADPAYVYMCADMSLQKLFTQKFDYLMVGHSHQFGDFVESDCRVLNAGSDYGRPKFIEVEI